MPNRSRPIGGERRGSLAVPGLLVALLLALVPALTGLSGRALGQEDVEAGQALLRVVHASPDAGAVDVLLDDQPILTNVAFAQVSEYLPVPDGEHNVKVVPTGGAADAAVIDQEIDLEDGVPYIFAAAGLVADIEGHSYTVDRNRIEDPNAARVRVIHLSPDAGPVDVFVAGGDALFEGIDYTDAADYREIAAGTYDLEVRSSEEGGGVTLESPGVSFDAGMVYDLLAVGQVADNSLQLLNTSTATLQSCMQTLGLQGAPEDACIRVVHASPDAPNVDVFIDEGGQPAVTGLAFASASPSWIPVPAGQHQFNVTLTGEPLDSSVADAELELEAGTAYDIVVLNVLDDLQVTSYEPDLSPVAEGQARLRAIHAAQDVGQVDVAIAGGAVLFEDLEFEEASDDLEIQAGPVTLELRDDEGNVLLTNPDLTFAAGTTYHIYVIGRTEDQSLQLLVLEAQPAQGFGGAATPVAATPGASPVATPVDEDAEATVEGAADEAGDAAEDLTETPEG